MDRSLKRDRQLLMMAVLDGSLGPEHMTMKELEALHWRVAETVYWKKVDELNQAGYYVFDEIETEWLQ
jgi:hypothetical protein